MLVTLQLTQPKPLPAATLGNSCLLQVSSKMGGIGKTMAPLCVFFFGSLGPRALRSHVSRAPRHQDIIAAVLRGRYAALPRFRPQEP